MYAEESIHFVFKRRWLLCMARWRCYTWHNCNFTLIIHMDGNKWRLFRMYLYTTAVVYPYSGIFCLNLIHKFLLDIFTNTFRRLQRKCQWKAIYRRSRHDTCVRDKTQLFWIHDIWNCTHSRNVLHNMTSQLQTITRTESRTTPMPYATAMTVNNHFRSI